MLVQVASARTFVWDVAGLRDTEVAGNDCDGNQRKGGNSVDVLRRKSRRWALLAVNRVDVLRWEAEEDRRKVAAGEEQQRQRGDGLQKRIVGCARRKERREEEGCEQDLLCVRKKQRDPGPAWDLEHSRAPRLQGRRPLVPMCRSVGKAGDRGGGRDERFRWRSIPAK
ncbi:hypothetical protein BHM03_00004777 [Ensete ventricosum]|nr:hypothetical protein BHM03_00004777 [Ensete ventricosum]